MIITEAIMESIIKALFSRKILDFDHFISLFTSGLTDIHVVETFLQSSTPSLLILVSMISPSVQMYGFHFGLCGATFARIKDISGIYVVECARNLKQ